MNEDRLKLIALAAIAVAEYGPCAELEPGPRPYPEGGYVHKCKGRAYTRDDARARRKRISRWRAKKGGK